MSAPIASKITSIIDIEKMTWVHYTTLFICFLMNVLDGMDVVVISYVASSISTEWTVSPQSMGIVFSAALVGMTVGALFIAPLGDKFGRKKLILISAIVMGVSVLLTAYAESINQLLFLRFLSGLGIGGMLATTSTLASEYAPNRNKDFWVSWVLSGYPIGAVLAGLVSSWIIPEYGWRAMFHFAGIMTLVTLPLIFFFLSPSLEFLIKTRPANALKKINGVLKKMGLAQLEELPILMEKPKAVSVKSLFADQLGKKTLLLWLAFFMAFSTLYFLLSWIPKLTIAAGLGEKLGIYAGTVFNLGSFIGIVTLGSLSLKIGLKRSISIFLISSAVFMAIFGLFQGSTMVLIIFGLIGFSMQGGFIGLYPLAARIYPVEIRSTGTGWAIGAGRFGAIIGPILAGYFIGAGISLSVNFILFAIPCLIAGVVTTFIHHKNLS